MSTELRFDTSSHVTKLRPKQAACDSRETTQTNDSHYTLVQQTERKFHIYLFGYNIKFWSATVTVSMLVEQVLLTVLFLVTHGLRQGCMSHATKNKSFRTRSSQPISWLDTKN